MTPRALPIPSLSFPSVRPAPDSSNSIASLRFPRLSSSPAANVPRQCQSMRCQSNQTLTADSVDVDSLAKCFDQNHLADACIMLQQGHSFCPHLGLMLFLQCLAAVDEAHETPGALHPAKPGLEF